MRSDLSMPDVITRSRERAVRFDYSAPDLVARAREMVPDLAKLAAATDANRAVPEESIARMADLGLFKVLQPQHYGGSECDFEQFSLITSTLAQGCSSSAWVYCVISEHPWLISSLPREAQDEFWATPDTRASSSLVPLPNAEVTEGGIVLTGRWPFSSGCDHVQWAILGVRVPTSAGESKVYQALVPMKDLRILDDWNVLGLRGTGSKSLIVDKVFVPWYRTVEHSKLLTATSPGRDIHPEMVLLRVPRSCLAPISLGSVHVGIAQRAFTEFREHAVQRGMANSESTQLAIAESSAEADGARTLLTAVCRRITAKARDGDPIGLPDIAQARRDALFAAKLCRQAVLRLYLAAGAHAIFDNHPLQLTFRDSQAAASHVSQRWEIGGVLFGKTALGVAVQEPV